MSRSLPLGLCSSSLFALLWATGCSDSEKAQCEGETCDSANGSAEQSNEDSPTGQVKDAGSKRDAAVLRDSGNPAPSGGKNLPCDVQAVVDKYCSTCHGSDPAYGAPMALVAASDFAAKGVDGKTSVAKLAVARLNADSMAMPPTTSPQPTASERALLSSWASSGAVGSNATCASTGTPDGGIVNEIPAPEGLDCYKLTAHDGDFKTPFKVGVARDAYFNFTFAAPWTGVAYGIQIRPVIDNMKAIHHWLLFEDDAPGTPSGAVKSIGAHPAGQLLYGWAPGGDPFDFRSTGADVGLELPATTYTVEFHYNSSDAAATDASGVEICVQKKKPANIAGLSWLGNDQLLVPSAKWTGTCKPTSKDPIHMIALIPHMHVQGRHMSGTITRANGTKQVLHDEAFDFNYQKLYPKNETLMPGDSITTVCDFAQPMTFGESTTAEMCYLFTMAYPKGALSSPDLWGSFAHGGSSCLGQ